MPLLIIIVHSARLASRKGRRISSRGNFGERVFHFANQFLKGVPLSRADPFGGILDLLALVCAASSIRLDGIARSRLPVNGEPIPRSLFRACCRFRVLVRVPSPVNVPLSRREIRPQGYIIVQLFVLLNLQSVITNAQIAPR